CRVCSGFRDDLESPRSGGFKPTIQVGRMNGMRCATTPRPDGLTFACCNATSRLTCRWSRRRGTDAERAAAHRQTLGGHPVLNMRVTKMLIVALAASSWSACG